MEEETKLPLRSQTPDAWASEVLSDRLALLGDHAYLEKKAASNALELLNRWPDAGCAAEWSSHLASVANDETAHLAAVLKILGRRGGKLPRVHRNGYATGLRSLVRRGSGNLELVDRLLVSALIEARSCERFEILGRACESSDRELSRFYRSLGSSERGHYVVFLHLASMVVTRESVEHRWLEFLDAEANILAAQPLGPTMHSGFRHEVGRPNVDAS